MVLGLKGPGRVGRRRFFLYSSSRLTSVVRRLLVFLERPPHRYPTGRWPPTLVGRAASTTRLDRPPARPAKPAPGTRRSGRQIDKSWHSCHFCRKRCLLGCADRRISIAPIDLSGEAPSSSLRPEPAAPLGPFSR